MIELRARVERLGELVVPPAPEVLTGLRERDLVRFDAGGAPGLLYIDDAPVERLEWEVGFYAGRVLARWVDPTGRETGRWLLDVSPDPHKLGLAHFQALATELAAFDLRLLVGEEPATREAGREGSTRDALVAYARILQDADELLRVLDRIAAAPHRSIEAVREQVSLPQLRRLDAATLLAARGSTGVLRTLAGEGVTGVDRLDVPDARWTVDSGANRTLKRGLQRLVRRCLEVDAWLARRVLAEEDSATRTALRERIGTRRERLGRFRASVESLLARAPWITTTRAEISAAGLNAIAASPTYARAWRLLRRMQGDELSAEGADFLWMSPTWEVFERWCFVRLGLALGLDPAECRPRAGALRVWRGARGGRPLALWLQARAPAIDQPPANGFQSVSGERAPDLVLCLGDQFVVLDAKYSVGRLSVLRQMTSAHVYRDALRWEGRTATHSGLVVPCPTEAPLLEADDYRKHGLGVWPATDWARLVAFLDAV